MLVYFFVRGKEEKKKEILHVHFGVYNNWKYRETERGVCVSKKKRSTKYIKSIASRAL